MKPRSPGNRRAREAASSSTTPSPHSALAILRLIYSPSPNKAVTKLGVHRLIRAPPGSLDERDNLTEAPVLTLHDSLPRRERSDLLTLRAPGFATRFLEEVFVVMPTKPRFWHAWRFRKRIRPGRSWPASGLASSEGRGHGSVIRGCLRIRSHRRSPRTPTRPQPLARLLAALRRSYLSDSFIPSWPRARPNARQHVADGSRSHQDESRHYQAYP